MAAQCASYISVGRSYFLINGLLFYHLAPELSRRAALAIRNVPVAQRNIPFHSVPFHVELCGMYRGMESRSVRYASGKDKIRFSFGHPATVSLQLFSFLFVVFSFLFFFFLVSVAVDFLAKAMFLFSCCVPLKFSFSALSFFRQIVLFYAAKRKKILFSVFCDCLRLQFLFFLV